MKRIIINPYSVLLDEIRQFVAQLKKADAPRRVSRGTLKAEDIRWLHECCTTAEKLGFRVEAIAKDDNTVEFVLVENTKRPEPNWNWT